MNPSFINNEANELMQLLRKKNPDKNIHSHSESVIGVNSVVIIPPLAKNQPSP